MAWTGIGSRETPLIVCEIMRLFATTMRTSGRSGAAPRADNYFERGMLKPEIYLPWRDFEKHKTGTWDYTREQIRFAEGWVNKIYPVVVQKRSHMMLFRRNVFQVVGLCERNADAKPSKFVICWTPDGCTNKATYHWGVTGGTGVAILLAERFDVPVYNLQRKDHMLMALEHLEDHNIRTVKLRKQLKVQGLLAA